MDDTSRVFRDIDQKHNSYTKKFGLIKSRFDKLQGEIDELRAQIIDLKDIVGIHPRRRGKLKG